MSDNKDTDEGKTIRGSRTMTLKLEKTVDAGHVQQSFSQGRKKTVVVEKKKKRVLTRPGAKAPAVAKAVVAPVSTPQKAEPPKPAVAKRGRPGSGNARPQRTSGGGASDKLLSNAEMDARTRALQMARERDVVEAAQKIKDDVARAEQEKLDAIEREKQAVIEAAKPKVEPAKPSVVAKKPAGQKPLKWTRPARKPKPKNVVNTPRRSPRPKAKTICETAVQNSKHLHQAEVKPTIADVRAS